MAIKVGQEIQLRIAGTWIAAESDTSFSAACDMLDATTKSSTSAAKEFKGGETSATMSASGLYDPAQTQGFNDILALLQARAAVAIIWGEATTSTKLFSCSGLISGVSCNGPKNDIANYTVDIQITGVVTESSL